MPKILICGHFANGAEAFDGQTIKTVNLYKELLEKYGKENIIISDTYFIKKRPFKFFYNLKCNISKVDNVIILPAQRGIKIIVPLLNLLNKKKRFKIHYVVIGAWLPDIAMNNKFLQKNLKKINFIYVETKNTIKRLEDMGFDNLYQMNNFKKLVVSESKYKNSSKELRCCIFSRIEYLKGINDAIDVVNEINSESSKKIYLNLYGKIKDEYALEFQKRIENNEYISYKGIVDSNKSVETIEDYNLLLFPTLYYTEGIPGTIIDSYFAGVPVLSSKWENFTDVIEENKTGLGYKFADKEEFKRILIDILNDKYDLEQMSDNCKKRALDYLPDNSLNVLYKNLGDLGGNK